MRFLWRTRCVLMSRLTKTYQPLKRGGHNYEEVAGEYGAGVIVQGP